MTTKPDFVRACFDGNGKRYHIANFFGWMGRCTAGDPPTQHFAMAFPIDRPVPDRMIEIPIWPEITD